MKDVARIPPTMPRSGIRSIMELASELEGVIHLEMGEPDFPKLEHVVKAAYEAARQRYTRYTSSSGLPSLQRRDLEAWSKTPARPPCEP